MFDTSNREKYGIIYTGAGGEKDLPSRKNLQKQNKIFFGKRFAELIAEAGTASGRCKDIGGGRQTLPPFLYPADHTFKHSNLTKKECTQNGCIMQ